MFTSEQLSDYLRSIIHCKTAALARAQDDEARQKINEGARRFLAPLEIEPPAQWDGRLELRGLRLPSPPDDAVKLLLALGIVELDVSENNIKKFPVPFSLNSRLKKLLLSQCSNPKTLDAIRDSKIKRLILPLSFPSGKPQGHKHTHIRPTKAPESRRLRNAMNREQKHGAE